MGQDEKKYPFEKIRAAADMASSMRKDDLSKIKKLLEDQDSAVRYWGALGLLMQEKAGVKHGKNALTKALQDSSPYVRVIAAEALGKFGNKKDLKVRSGGQATDPVKNGCFPSMLAIMRSYLDDKAKSPFPKYNPY